MYFSHIAIVLIWSAISISLVLLVGKLTNPNAISKARLLVGYLILSLLALLFLVGKAYIPSEYFANIVTEVIGIALTVLIIDQVNQYLTKKDESLFRDLALRHCRMPIFTYCQIWFAIYEPDQKKRKAKALKHSSINDLFQSNEFYQTISSFNFATPISADKTYAQTTTNASKRLRAPFNQYSRSMLQSFLCKTFKISSTSEEAPSRSMSSA